MKFAGPARPGERRGSTASAALLAGPRFALDRGRSLSTSPSLAGGIPPRLTAGAGPSPLPDRLKSGVEFTSGLSMADVRVHYNSPEPARFGAKAFARGPEIHVASGEERHIAHEAWHVVQQKLGRVRPTETIAGTAVNSDAALEREADVQGDRALAAGGSTHCARPAAAVFRPVLQGVFTDSLMTQLAGLAPIDRIRILATAPEQDLDAYLRSEYHYYNPHAVEEQNLIFELRRRFHSPPTFTTAEHGSEMEEEGREPRTFDYEPEVEDGGEMEASAPYQPLTIDELLEAGGEMEMEPQSPLVSIEEHNCQGQSNVRMKGVKGPVDIDMTDVDGRMDVEMENVSGDVAMDIEAVRGNVAVHLSEVHGTVHLTLVGEQAAWPEAAPELSGDVNIGIANVRGALLLEIFPGREPMQLQFGPVEEGRMEAHRIGKRKRESVPETHSQAPPALAHTKDEEDTAEMPSDPDFDIFVEQFSALSISFRSDVDDQEHYIYPSADLTTIIVKSNPVPLHVIITSGVWQGVAIAAIVIAALQVLQSDAQKALKAFAAQRTKTAGNALRKSLRAIAKALKSLTKNTDLPPTDLSTSVGYPSNAHPTEGKHLIADPLSLNSKSVGHRPNDGRLMTAIRHLAGPQASSYKQMHLLNDNVFGPGELWNLTPGPAKSNTDMENLVETYLKNAVISKGLVIGFEAIVTYKHDPVAASQQDINHNPDKFKFEEINFKAYEYAFDGGTNTWKKVPNKDSDIKKIHGAKIKWKYGNLPPLKPKPRILDPATTVQELVDAGIPLAAARRISNFVGDTFKKKGRVSIPPTNKKQNLAEMVKDFDGKKKMATGWNASAVFWT